MLMLRAGDPGETTPVAAAGDGFCGRNPLNRNFSGPVSIEKKDFKCPDVEPSPGVCPPQLLGGRGVRVDNGALSGLSVCGQCYQAPLKSSRLDPQGFCLRLKVSKLRGLLRFCVSWGMGVCLRRGEWREVIFLKSAQYCLSHSK